DPRDPRGDDDPGRRGAVSGGRGRGGNAVAGPDSGAVAGGRRPGNRPPPNENASPATDRGRGVSSLGRDCRESRRSAASTSGQAQSAVNPPVAPAGVVSRRISGCCGSAPASPRASP